MSSPAGRFQSAYQAFAGWVGDKPWFRAVASRVLPRVDTVLLRFRGWQATPFPTLLLTTTGHRTGAPHDAPLYYLEDRGYIVIATNYGRADPDWSRNLAARPIGTVKLGREITRVRAERVSPEAWPGYLEQFGAFYPPYHDYVARSDHDIPMWWLLPSPGYT